MQTSLTAIQEPKPAPTEIRATEVVRKPRTMEDLWAMRNAWLERATARTHRLLEDFKKHPEKYRNVVEVGKTEAPRSRGRGRRK